MKTSSNRYKEKLPSASNSTKIFIFSAVIAFAAGFFILFHQYIVWGYWFEPDDFLHHEVFAGLLIAFGCGLLVAPVILKLRRVETRKVNVVKT